MVFVVFVILLVAPAVFPTVRCDSSTFFFVSISKSSQYSNTNFDKYRVKMKIISVEKFAKMRKECAKLRKILG